jgi:hypothetical protein
MIDARRERARYPKDNPLIVVFDIGNVLLRWDRRDLFRKTFDDEARMERFLATACSMDWIVHTDVVADFSRAVAERAKAKAFPEFAEELRLFDAQWIETLGGPIEQNVALMRRLKAADRPVHALSNFAAEKFALARAVRLPQFRDRHALRPRRIGKPGVQGRQHCAGVFRARQMQRVGRGEFRREIAHEFFRSLELGPTVTQRSRSGCDQIEARQSSRGFTWTESSAPGRSRHDRGEFEAHEVAHNDLLRRAPEPISNAVGLGLIEDETDNNRGVGIDRHGYSSRMRRTISAALSPRDGSDFARAAISSMSSGDQRPASPAAAGLISATTLPCRVIVTDSPASASSTSFES